MLENGRYAAAAALALLLLAIGCAQQETVPKPCRIQAIDQDITHNFSPESTDIYVINVSSCDSRIFNFPAHPLDLAWSPEGDQIAVILGGKCPLCVSTGLYLLSASDTKSLKLLLEAEDVGDDYGTLQLQQGGIAWSPDGQWLTLRPGIDSLSVRSDRRGDDLWLVRSNGSGAVNLTPRADQMTGSYSWSPSSRWLAFELLQWDTQDGRWYKYLAVADMTQEPPTVRVLIERTWLVEVSWTPGVDRIVGRFLLEEPRMVVKLEDGGRFPEETPTPAPTATASQWPYVVPGWSPDGTKIALPCRQPLNDSGTALSQPWVCITTGDLRKAKPVHEGELLDWSPDSQYLAVQLRGHVYTVRTDGKQAHEVTQYSPRYGKDVGRGAYPVESIRDFRWTSPEIMLFTVTYSSSSIPGVGPSVHLATRDGRWHVALGSSENLFFSSDGQWVAVLPPYGYTL